MSLDANDRAPDFKVPDQDGNIVSLKDFKGQAVVLFFFPKADTPGWTVEACGFRDAFQKIQKAGASMGTRQMRKGEKWEGGITVLGISADTPEKQKKFKEKYDLPYTLLADTDKTVCKAYGVIKEKNMYGKKMMGIERTTFLIDGQGKIARIFPKVKADGHAEEVLAALQQA